MREKFLLGQTCVCNRFLKTFQISCIPYFIFVFLFIFYFQSICFSAGKDECEKLLVPSEGESAVDVDLAIDLEKHSLSSLLRSDPESNLAYQHPSLVMSAAQRILAMLYGEGTTTTASPISPNGRTVVYHIFSSGRPTTHGRRIIGNHAAIGDVVHLLQAAARKDRSGVTMPLLEGPHGTGKTEFLHILRAAAINLTTKHPNHFVYTVEWRDLSQIPELEPFVQKNESGMELPRRCPINDSPFTLLPEAFQDEVVKVAEGRIAELSRSEPNPVRQPCPQCQFFRREVLRHYAEQAKGGFSLLDIVRALERHTTIRRVVMGRPGTVPIIPPQGEDVDLAGLFFAPNAFFRNIYGPNHPMSVFLNGQVMAGNGMAVFLDDFLRNHPNLRDVFLNVLESREVTIGASPTTSIDTVFFSGTNTASVLEAQSDPTEAAHLDRTGRIPFLWPTAPHFVAGTMVYMKGEGLYQQPLPIAAKSGLVPAHLDALFPPPVSRQPILGPDGYFKLWFGKGEKKIHLSPHTLMYVAQIVGATRMETDVEAAKKVEPSMKTSNDIVFRDVVTRLRALMGEYPISTTVAAELDKLTRLLREGSFGISARDAGRWLTSAVAEASLPGNDGCITPVLVKRVFERQLTDGSIEYPDHETRIRWMRIANVLAEQLLLPRLQNDIASAIGRDEGQAGSIYDQVVAELIALQENPEAGYYEDPADHRSKVINRKRLEAIQEKFREINRRSLDPQQISNYHLLAGQQGQSFPRYKPLLDAINAYQASIVTEAVSLDDLLKFATQRDGKTLTRSTFETMSRAMTDELGYCPHCMRAALEISLQAEEQKARRRQTEQ